MGVRDAGGTLGLRVSPVGAPGDGTSGEAPDAFRMASRFVPVVIVTALICHAQAI
jgi:hypothetical protein